MSKIFLISYKTSSNRKTLPVTCFIHFLQHPEQKKKKLARFKYKPKKLQIPENFLYYAKKGSSGKAYLFQLKAEIQP